jgi:FG-GAP-like repeat/Bacterial Ig-like domain
MKNLVLLPLILLPLLLFAQSPQVSNTTPTNQSLAVTPTSSIVFEFTQPLDPATINYSSFKIFGRWSGPMAFAFSISNNNTTVELLPEKPFFAGESVSVGVSTSLKGANGISLERGYSIGFGVATSGGTLIQTFIEEIPLRFPGEGLIQTYGAYAGDLNNDGYSDLTVINENSDDLRILLNDGYGNYTDITLFDMGVSKPSPNEGADFNNDGEIDLVVSTAHGNEVRILLGDGAGNFSSMEIYNSGEASRGVGVLDLDGDGDDDLAVTNRDDSNMSLLFNDGTGLFDVNTLDLDLTGQGETAIAIADVNNDGIMDAFVGCYGSQELAVYLGDGDGDLELSNKKTTNGRPWMIAAGDLNGDGFADVASANSEGNVIAVAFGDGQGNIAEPVHFSSAGNFPLAMDLGDLDGDGDLDMVSSNYASANFVVFENNGFGVFSIASTLASPNKASCAILHDRDNDGDLDITATDEGDDVLLIHRNGMPTATEELEPFTLSGLWPNPFEDRLTLSYQLSHSALVVAELYDLLGKKVRRVEEGQLSAGFHQFILEGGGLESGMYMIRFAVDGMEYGFKVVKR